MYVQSSVTDYRLVPVVVVPFLKPVETPRLHNISSGRAVGSAINLVEEQGRRAECLPAEHLPHISSIRA